MTTLPAHSPLGASSAERWMNCPGSVNLIKSLPPQPEAPDPEYRKEGSAAHAAIAYCLSGKGFDAWEVIGEMFEGVVVTEEMANAIQVFIDAANALAAGADKTFVEERIGSPEHPMFYGTVDFAAIKEGTLYILDFKYGQGIVVETAGNPQMMYYAYGILLANLDVRRVSMQIIQPRIPHDPDPPFVMGTDVLAMWGDETLFPAMTRTETDTTLCPGEHCRFCDAKAALACPALKQQFTELETPVDPTMDDVALMALYPKIATVKMHIKALEDETLRRLMDHGLQENGVVKLVNKKANRVWKPDAVDVFKSRFGEKVWNEPEFKSPAEMEKVDASAKKMVHEYAYTPQSGYTVALLDDKRPAVVLKKPTDQFAGALEAIDAGDL